LLYRLSYPGHVSTLNFMFIALHHLTDYYFPSPFSEYMRFNGVIPNRSSCYHCTSSWYSLWEVGTIGQFKAVVTRDSILRNSWNWKKKQCFRNRSNLQGSCGVTYPVLKSTDPSGGNRELGDLVGCHKTLISRTDPYSLCQAYLRLRQKSSRQPHEWKVLSVRRLLQCSGEAAHHFAFQTGSAELLMRR
jgi:hypothetical protein